MEMKVETIVGIAGGVVGLVGAGLGVYTKFNTDKTLRKMGVSVDKLSEMTEVEVSKELVESTVKKKVDKVVSEEVSTATRRLVDSVQAEMRTSISTEVKKAVKEASESIERDVKERYEKEIEAIDIEELKKDILREGKRSVERKLEGSLQTLVNLANEKVGSQLDVYSSVSEFIKKKVQ